MTNAADLAEKIAEILGQLTSHELSTLGKSKGYAYEAYVLSVLGDQLESAHQWQWVHPAQGPTFAKGNGGGIQLRTSRCSHLKSTQRTLQQPDDRVLVQGLTVKGKSVTHDLDLAVCLPNTPPTAGTFDREHVFAAVEIKNHSQPVSVGALRNVLGLAHELKIWRCYAKRYFAMYLISSSRLTTRAKALANNWGILCEPKAAPPTPTSWAVKVASRLDRAR